ncbi:YigZ family protein [Helicobacter sp. MIT 21-1697]|uniref:YigZ family protein n=1 Tax=Helicobacter sp. MIT 21-1697 TaxID=2993733 RepID=UPI00224A99C3|nr:YigZ family protein [Helicobacter sp. MIT 21-1697]MCX2716732.1 YigZ family protein [Helicobacter sp. MIT 21-1697]
MKTLAIQDSKQVPLQIQGSFESKGSKFLSFLFPFVQFDEGLLCLKKQHSKAVHFVSASRHYNEYGQILESFDDDKEPRGSSGTPSLNVLRGEELIEVGVVIVRYFGGTLLGVGGLVRAYTNAVQEAIESAKAQGLLIDYIHAETFSLHIAYSALSVCEYEAKKLGLDFKKEAFLPFGVQVRVQGEKKCLEMFKTMYNNNFVFHTQSQMN